MNKVHLHTENKNTSTLTIEGEGHTLGNLLRERLSQDEDTLFVGYRLENETLIVKLKTKETTTPESVLIDSINSILRDIGKIRQTVLQELS